MTTPPNKTPILLTEEDATILQEVIDREARQPRNQISEREYEQTTRAPATYIVKIPSADEYPSESDPGDSSIPWSIGGIPALRDLVSPNVPGCRLCDVYTLNYKEGGQTSADDRGPDDATNVELVPTTPERYGDPRQEWVYNCSTWPVGGGLFYPATRLTTGELVITNSPRYWPPIQSPLYPHLSHRPSGDFHVSTHPSYGDGDGYEQLHFETPEDYWFVGGQRSSRVTFHFPSEYQQKAITLHEPGIWEYHLHVTANCAGQAYQDGEPWGDGSPVFPRHRHSYTTPDSNTGYETALDYVIFRSYLAINGREPGGSWYGVADKDEVRVVSSAVVAGGANVKHHLSGLIVASAADFEITPVIWGVGTGESVPDPDTYGIEYDLLGGLIHLQWKAHKEVDYSIEETTKPAYWS